MLVALEVKQFCLDWQRVDDYETYPDRQMVGKVEVVAHPGLLMDAAG